MLNFVMVIHCHQPVGNFDHVFDMAHEKCYRPLLDLLRSHPSVKVGLHFSGPLLEWIEEHQADTIDLLTELIQSGQVEPLSGGFFEPLLASIPLRDAQGQVRMMNDYITGRFGRKPTGFWLTERVWDPCLPLTLAGTEMTYTVVDDTHFYYAGLKPEDIYGRYVTEREGSTLSLLATPMAMRYLIPFKPVEEVIDHMRGLEETHRDLVVYADDGEKFGLWPGTHEWVIKKGWLEKFFTSIVDNSDWLRSVLPGDFIKSSPPSGRIYLPQASYEEMTEWALPTERSMALENIIETLKSNGHWEKWRPFVRGGVWDNFLVKYDESNWMHKKMLFLSERVSQFPESRISLWRGQCNCAYWHGVFGGLYLGHLRRAIHQNLIRAQSQVIEESGQDLQILQLDLNKDGAEEVLVWNHNLSLGIEPRKGGGFFEISHLSRGLNLSDTLTRRHESYHRQLQNNHQVQQKHPEGINSIHDVVQTENEELRRLLVFDRYSRASLLDHFIEPQLNVEAYASNHYDELGDFVQGQYDVEQAQVLPAEALVELKRFGQVGHEAMALKKTVRVGKNAQIRVEYDFESNGAGPISCLYGCEFNLTVYSDADPERYYLVPESGRRHEVTETGQEKDVSMFEVINRPDRIIAAFTVSPRVSVWFFPLITVSKSERGFEHTYQGSNLLFTLPINLSPGKKANFQIDLRLIEL